MLALFWSAFGVLLALLAFLAGYRVHLRRAELAGSRRPVLDDAAVDRIIEYGEIFIDEDDPLDLDGIDDEERRFWSESWDEPRGEW